ncbi:MAG: hypothetical protein ACFFBD_28365 [Candidatus Hodarchaeota archaeon]
MLTEARRKFFLIIGNAYEEYGFPHLCGWIEALFMLEPQTWTQKGISERLSELFPESEYPTSVASVNRALKIFETYGYIVKSGSRKLGYTYQLAPSSNMILAMFQRFIILNENFIKELAFFKGNYGLDDDPPLQNTVDLEIEGLTFFNHIIERFLGAMESEIEGEKNEDAN